MKTLLASLMLFALCAAHAFAATKTARLSVPTMTCAACPITVKHALERVDGVIEAKVSWEPREAIVIYDDAKTNIRSLTEATRNAGYPSSLQP